MLKEIVSPGYLKIHQLEKGISAAMCDRDILQVYKKELESLETYFKDKLVWGLCPYSKALDAEIVYYAHSFPVYLGGLVSVPNTFTIKEQNNIDLAQGDLLKLCDYHAVAELKIQGNTHKMICGVLAMDKHKRKSLDSAQIWIREEDTSIPENVLDWFCHYFITNGFSPVVVSRHKMYTDSSIIHCGVYYKGE